MMRPRGMPWPPSAMSSDRLPVGMPSIGPRRSAPRAMIGPFAELLLDLLQRCLEVRVRFQSRAFPVARLRGRIARLDAFATFLCHVRFRLDYRNHRTLLLYLRDAGRFQVSTPVKVPKSVL